MSFVNVTTGSAFDDSGGSVTTLDAAVSGVAAGDAVVAWVKYEGASTTSSVSTAGGSDTFTAATQVDHGNGDLHGRFFYLTSATVTGSVTYRVTYGAGRPYCRLLIAVIRPDAGDTITLEAQATGSGSSTTPTSGAISPAGTDLAVFGGFGEYASSNPSTLTINGSSSGLTTVSASYSRMWHALLTSGFTNGTAAGSGYTSADWICNILALRAEAGGGGGSTSFPFARRFPRAILRR